MKRLLLFLTVVASAALTAAAVDTPFSFTARLGSLVEDKATVLINGSMKEGAYLYADQLSVSSEQATLRGTVIPDPKKKYDEFLEQEVTVYDHDFAMAYEASGVSDGSVVITIDYQGCDKTICYRPDSITLTVTESGSTVGTTEPVVQPTVATAIPASAESWQALASDFKETGRNAGYMAPGRFIEFLDTAEKASGDSEGFTDSLIQNLENSGLILTMILILFGGLALNLTPCVLPMIPINIAIIGAGAQAGSKTRGFALGGVYGLGIAAAYGALGVVCVKTGAAFGTLQSMPAFNFAIAALFAVLSLAMFGVINIDLTKYQSKIGPKSQSGGHFAVAFVMGAVSALLAGACVAPVVIWVLIYSTDLYSQGYTAALAIPFVLGAGMALPWPFAGAGLSLLPKPGKWMEKVKYAFGVLIILFAAYYGYEGYQLTRVSHGEQDSHEGWITSLEEGFATAEKEGKPIFLDFWATWCKSCLAMDRNTFPDEEVAARLEKYIKIKFPAENPRDPEVEKVLKHFGVIGLPTYLVLSPDD